MSTPSKRILVLGATGKAGGGVVKALADLNSHLSLDSSNAYTILAVTRSPSSAKSQALLAFRGVELVEGNLNDPQALFASASLRGPIYGVFSVQQSIENPDKGVIGEIRQGKGIADVAAENGVQHFVYLSNSFGGSEDTGVPHFDSKREIEAHISSLNLPATILRPVSFMDGFLDWNTFQGKIFSTLLTKQTLSSPEKKLQLVACSSIGMVAATAFENPTKYPGRTIPLAGDELTIPQLEDSFKNVMGQDLPTTYWILPALIKWMVADLGKMLRFLDKPGYEVDVPALKEEFPGMKTWEEFVRTEIKPKQ